MSSTRKLASEIAELLNADPILADQVFAELSDERGREIAEIKPDLEGLETSEVIKELVGRKVSLAEIIKCYRQQTSGIIA